MLYVSTRDYRNTYTAHRTLFEQCASDGGMFAPFRLPEFTREEIQQMKTQSFGSNVALILNLFFNAHLTSWDVEFCCGRCPVDLISLPRKLLIAELWHNTASTYAHIERALYEKLCGGSAPDQITPWAKIAIRTAVFFAVYAICSSMKNFDELDFAVDDLDFTALLAVWYARRIGLPVGMIICGSYDNGVSWDLLHRGELNTASCNRNIGMEQLIHATLGQDETCRFVDTCRNRRTYLVDEQRLTELNNGIFVAVTSADRIENIITNFNQSNNYMLDHSAAVGYGALQDYRACEGESRATMVFSLFSPK